MEQDKNPFPSIDLFPLLSRVARAAGSLLIPFHCQAEPYMSEHYNRGGGPALDRALNDEQLPLWT